MKYKINLFNENYITITTTTIIRKHYEYMDNNNLNSTIWHKLYIALKNTNVPAISPIAIEKNTIEAQIIMNELNKETKNITIEDIKNSCIIATYKGNPIANKLANIILTNPYIDIFGNVTDMKTYFGEEITNYIINNNSIQKYYDLANGKLPYEYDKYVFLYENGTLTETTLPVPEKIKIRTKTK